jgi:hypothetical protein
MPRILVTGSRTWTNRTVIQSALRQAWMDLGANHHCVLVSGHCPDGADAIAEAWWAQSGMPVERHPANWLQYGASAGPRRNKEMVDLGADICLAFMVGQSKGTAGTIALAKAAGIPTVIHEARY